MPVDDVGIVGDAFDLINSAISALLIGNNYEWSEPLDFRRLQYFVVTAEELHMGRAAERLGIAQPTLSQQIQTLETSLGVRLFERVRRGIQLSAVGKALLPQALETLAASARAIEIAHGAARGEIGQIMIGYVGTALIEPELPNLIADFRKRYPGIRLDLRNLPVDQQLEQLSDLRIDIAFIRATSTAVPSGLRGRVFSSTRLLAAIPATHPLATSAEPSLRQLADDPFIVLQDTPTTGFFAATTVAFCERAGFIPNIDLKVTDIASMVGLVSAGLGVCLVPALISSLAMPNVVFRALPELDAAVDLLMIERRNDRSPAVKSWLDMAFPA